MPTATEALRERFPHLVTDSHQQHGDETVLIRPEGILDVARFLREDPDLKFRILLDLTAVDWPEQTPRFEVVYHFYAPERRARLRVKARVGGEAPSIASLVSLWDGANWYEREVWDMFGIVFDGHPDLRRLLMYDEFEGHPLRKDYPFRRRQPRVGPLN